MNTHALRAVFALALIVSLVVRHHAISDRESATAGFDASAAIASVIRAAGVQILENPLRPPKILSSAVYFQRPKCSERSVVMPLAFNLEFEPILVRVAPPSYRRAYIYADVSSPVQNKVGVFAEWLKHAVLALTGATRYVPIKIAIVVAEPGDCTAVPAIDWRLVWDRERLTAAMQVANGVTAHPANSVAP